MKEWNIVFMGTPDFAVPSLTALVEDGYRIGCVVTQPDRPKGRKRVITPPPVKVAAEALGLPVWQPEKIREPHAVDKLRALKPDLIVTAAFGQILPKAILDMPALGCVNVHASLLPKYRGGAPIHWAIMNGERETGITLMYMAEALDAGDIIAQQAVPIAASDTVGTLHDKLSDLGQSLLRQTLPAIVSGRADAVPQDEAQATFAYNVRREDERIRWERPAQAIYNHIRGLNPWPVAYTTWGKQSLKLWASEVVTDGQATTTATPAVSEASGEVASAKREDIVEGTATGDRAEAASGKVAPGTVIGVSRQGIDVATGDGVLRLTDVQPAGKKRMSAAEFVRGVTDLAGTRLGSGDQ